MGSGILMVDYVFSPTENAFYLVALK
ncbi:tail fiber assembly protein, partial [Escherichia coli]|nr:tail fiber assembly protein [Escherichia coli]